MGSAVAHCCGGVTRIAGGRRHDGHRGQQAQRPQRPEGRVRPVPPVTLDDAAALEAQAARLRSSIARRRNVAGCSNKSDNVSEIVSHYEEILEKTERQLRELSTQQAKAKPPASPTHSRADPESTTCSSASTQQQGRCWSNVSTTLLAFDA